MLRNLANGVRHARAAWDDASDKLDGGARRAYFACMAKPGVAAIALLAVSGGASAQVASGSGVADSIVNGICQVMSPFVGKSKLVSLLLLLSLGVMITLWLLNENKEGVIVWILRVGVCVGVLINIFSVPALFGLPSPCGGV